MDNYINRKMIVGPHSRTITGEVKADSRLNTTQCRVLPAVISLEEPSKSKTKLILKLGHE